MKRPPNGATIILYKADADARPTPMVRRVRMVFHHNTAWRTMFPNDTDKHPGAPFVNQWAVYDDRDGEHLSGRNDDIDAPEKFTNNDHGWHTDRRAALVDLRNQLDAILTRRTEEAERARAALEVVDAELIAEVFR